MGLSHITEFAVIHSLPIKTLAACDGRYPTPDEERSILDWAASVPKRLQAANLIAQKETEIVREAIEQMKPRYSRFAPQHDRAWDKAARDMALVLRYTVQGMIVDDGDMPSAKVFVWVRSLLRGTGHTPQLIRDMYGAMIEATRRQLPADLIERVQPHLERMIVEMCNFAEPMQQAVN
ncbi:MAG: hypothetical protein C0467_05895 [Planctomycetaceae bacterium]|nr:hypothetical protein [Planctomycetaceae bacterium]